MKQTAIVGAVYGRSGLKGFWSLAAKTEDPKEVGVAVARVKWLQERLTDFGRGGRRRRRNSASVGVRLDEMEKTSSCGGRTAVIEKSGSDRNLQNLMAAGPGFRYLTVA